MRKTPHAGGNGMPDIWTHILCGNKSIATVDNEELYSEIINRLNIFKLGTQGPDIFYYYRFWSGLNTKGEKILGHLMHTNKTGEFLINCLKYLKAQSDRDNYFELLAYVMGFISHYSLDSIAHPYIYCYALSKCSENSSNYMAGSCHKKLEVVIDNIYIKENSELRLGGMQPYEAIDVGFCVPVSVNDCLRTQIKKIYNFEIKSNIINNAYRDMKLGLKLLHDPNNIKLRTIRFIEKILGTPEKYSCAFYPVIVDNSFDYMNVSHNEWNNPYKRQESCRESFNDLLNKAILESSSKILASIGFLNGEVSEYELKSFFPNISYLTGM